MKPTETFRPFSNGTEFMMWMENNCGRGRGCRNWRPDAATSRHGCPMEVALVIGEPKGKHGLRCGLLEPGPNGELVTAAGDASTWRCPEYRGRDEPDDRPRRGPRPSGDQMDLLDPRSAPERSRVLS